MGLFRNKPAKGAFTTIGRGATFGANVTLGPWSVIGSRCAIGNNVSFGDWACIGEMTAIEDGVEIGPHVVIGSHCAIGAGCVLPGYVHIQDGVVIADGTHLEGHELVTAQGIVENRCSALITSGDPNGTEPLIIIGIAGCFEVPPDVYHDEIFEEFMMGSEFLEQFRIDGPDSELEAGPGL